MHYAIAGDSVNSYAYDNSSVKMVSQSLAIKDDLLESDLENYSDYLATTANLFLPLLIRLVFSITWSSVALTPLTEMALLAMSLRASPLLEARLV